MAARSVRFDVAPRCAFDYLADPRNRAEWQSSLRRVEDVDGERASARRWVDVTVPGLRPRMETTVLDRPHRWTEGGTWRGIDAELTLEFTEDGDAAARSADARLVGAWPRCRRTSSQAAVLGVCPDLRRAARLLAARPV